MFVKNFSAAALAVSGLVLFNLSASAQPQPDPSERIKDAVFVVGNAAAVMPMGGKVDILAGHGSVIGEVVLDKPYSADSVTESMQILVDGNRITSTNRARLYRDAQGRTRREHVLDGIGAWQTAGDPVSMVMINDPVKDVSYFLDARAQTARELKPFRLERMPLPPDGPPPEGANIAVHQWVSSVAADRATAIEAEPYLDNFEAALPPALPMAPSGPIAFGAFGTFDGSGIEATTEDLGEQILEGVLARGTRQTQTIAAGAIGNELPIEIVQEQWYSADIEAVVLRRNFDPRFGETTYRLINLDRSEPSPELFSIPQDYDLHSVQGPASGTRHLSSDGRVPAPMHATPGHRVERRVFLVQPDAAKADSAKAGGE